MIARTIFKEILSSIDEKPVTIVTGARQVGKTTLVCQLEKLRGFSYVTLANPILQEAAKADPAGFLSLHPAPLIIDEVQKVPSLFGYLESEVDEKKRQGKKTGLYILTGSEAYKLLSGITESMRGRVSFIHMSPLSLSEIKEREEKPFKVDIKENAKRASSLKLQTLDIYDYIVRGFYPELYDNKRLNPSIFYADYLESYLAKDVSDIIDIKNKSKFLNLLMLLASLSGEELNYSSLSKAIGADTKTIQNWISVLIAGDIIFLLQPYNENSLTKQIVKRPKIYFCDTGLACFLAKVGSKETLIASYLQGRMMETFIVNEIIKSYKNNRGEKAASFYYYRDSSQHEIDFIILEDGKLNLLECKAGEQYSSKDIASFKELSKSKFEIVGKAIICTTKEPYPLGEGAYALPISSI